MPVRIFEPLAGYLDTIPFTPASLDKAIGYAIKEIDDEIRYLRGVRDKLRLHLSTSRIDKYFNGSPQITDDWRERQAAAIKEILK
jgi:hypothetical protein